MKNSIITDIFNGVAGNVDAIIFKNRNKDLLKEIADYYDKLKNRFSPKQIKMLDKFLTLYDENYCEEIDFYFAEGFKLGLRIAVECFEDKKSKRKNRLLFPFIRCELIPRLRTRAHWQGR